MANLDEYTIEVLKKDDKTIIPITTTQAVFTSTGKTVEDSIVEFDEIGEGELPDISPDVEVNPTIPEGVTPTSASTLRVGDDYYSMSGGGGKMYIHQVMMSLYSISASLKFITDFEETLDFAKLLNLLTNTDFNMNFVNGILNDNSGSSKTYPVIIVHKGYGSDIAVYYISALPSSATIKYYSSSCTFKDTVTEV